MRGVCSTVSLACTPFLAFGNLTDVLTCIVLGALRMESAPLLEVASPTQGTGGGYSVRNEDCISLLNAQTWHRHESSYLRRCCSICVALPASSHT